VYSIALDLARETHATWIPLRLRECALNLRNCVSQAYFLTVSLRRKRGRENTNYEPYCFIVTNCGLALSYLTHSALDSLIRFIRIVRNELKWIKLIIYRINIKYDSAFNNLMQIMD